MRPPPPPLQLVDIDNRDKLNSCPCNKIQIQTIKQIHTDRDHKHSDTNTNNKYAEAEKIVTNTKMEKHRQQIVTPGQRNRIKYKPNK